jgi:hypothetical protein
MNELDPRERELAATLRETLERKAAQPDALLEAALAATRAQVAQKPRRRHPWMMAAGGLALAASLAVVIVLPGGQPADPMPATAEAMPEDADLQFLEDMDVLVAMGERS